ncbi:MAG: sugar transferase, partial [Miltoncostaeaceae bacterium]
LVLVAAVIDASVVWLAIFAAYGLYTRPSVRIGTISVEGTLRDAFHPLILGSLIILLLAGPINRLFGGEVAGAVQAGATLGVALVLLPVARVTLRAVAARAMWKPARGVIVGSGQVASLLAEKLGSHEGYGIDLIGYVDDDPEAGHGDPGGLTRLGTRNDISEIVERNEVDKLIVAFSRAGHEEMLNLVREVRNPDVQVSIVPRFFEVFPSHATLDDLEGVPLITLPQVRLGTGARIIKRAFDLVAATALSIALLPVLAAIAIAIKIDSRGPIIFRQDRRGRGGSVFRIAKFRSMRVGAEAERMKLAHLNQVDGPLFKVDDDPRITKVGGFLRRTSLDELPQLWNVLIGDMSLVGPRPFVLHEADQITGWAERRLDMAPGVTGLWQAMGRNDLSYDEMIKLDYLYVTNWSLWWDIKILARTARAVLARDGAY